MPNTQRPKPIDTLPFFTYEAEDINSHRHQITLLPKLVEEVGAANAVLLAALRTAILRDNDEDIVDVFGAKWLRTPHARLGQLSGLSEHAARRAINQLIAGGYVIRDLHPSAGGKLDRRRLSYRPADHLDVEDYELGDS